MPEKCGYKIKSDKIMFFSRLHDMWFFSGVTELVGNNNKNLKYVITFRGELRDSYRPHIHHLDLEVEVWEYDKTGLIPIKVTSLQWDISNVELDRGYHEDKKLNPHADCCLLRLNKYRIFSAVGRIYFDLDHKVLIVTYDWYKNEHFGVFLPNKIKEEITESLSF